MPTARLGSCPDPGLNRGHLDLQSNALPTELPRPTGSHNESRSAVSVPSPYQSIWPGGQVTQIAWHGIGIYVFNL